LAPCAASSTSSSPTRTSASSKSSTRPSKTPTKSASSRRSPAAAEPRSRLRPRSMNLALDQLPAIAQLRAHPRRLRRVEAFTDLIGDTPLVRLSSLERETPGVEIWAKCEFANPGGSVKDRAAYRMIADAMDRGELRPGMNLIDSTSGNTGIAYSMIGASLDIKISLVMPSNVSVPRKQVTTAYGTEIIYSDPMDGSDGAIVMVRELVEAEPDRYYYPDQYSNPSIWRAHALGTGPEIWAQTRGRV